MSRTGEIAEPWNVEADKRWGGQVPSTGTEGSSLEGDEERLGWRKRYAPSELRDVASIDVLHDPPW